MALRLDGLSVTKPNGLKAGLSSSSSEALAIVRTNLFGMENLFEGKEEMVWEMKGGGVGGGERIEKGMDAAANWWWRRKRSDQVEGVRILTTTTSY